jgi:signal transduction histidine kinase/ActR/RegA family two-component response regulator
VAKTELKEIQAPFLRTTLWCLVAATLLIGVALALFRRVSLNLIGRIEASERALRQAQKMEAVGRLTGGVAHDFNNLLTVILSGLDSAKERLDPSELDDARDAAQRAAELTQQLLAFSRQQVLEPRAVDLSTQVRELARLLKRVLDAEIRLSVDVPDSAALAHVDPSQLQQLVINLALNAQDAMPRGGQLSITVSEVELDEAFVKDHKGATVGRYVLLSVLDDGNGMDARTLEHVFEPFFTTKAPGKGTGLGLATVYGIVQQSGGTIDVWSEPGRGARFDVYLPRARDSVPVVAVPKPATLPPLARNAVILVVDDEPAVRRAHRRTLRAEGFSVLEASSRAEALSVVRQAEHLDLVLCDVGLPDGSGVDVARELCQEHGPLRLMFASGHAADALSRYGLDGRVRFIQKPVGNRELLASVHRALSDPPANPFADE